jgi:hypothetical protein
MQSLLLLAVYAGYIGAVIAWIKWQKKRHVRQLLSAEHPTESRPLITDGFSELTSEHDLRTLEVSAVATPVGLWRAWLVSVSAPHPTPDGPLC